MDAEEKPGMALQAASGTDAAIETLYVYKYKIYLESVYIGKIGKQAQRGFCEKNRD